MSSDYTPNLRLTLQGSGDNPNTWGDITNEQVIDLIEEAIAGVVQVNCTGSSNINIATTTQNGATDQARNAVLQLVGTIGADIQLIVPSVQKLYVVDCQWSGPYTITIIPAGGLTGFEMSSGQVYFVYTSGTTVSLIAESTAVGVLEAANNLSDLTNITTARTNLGLGSMALQDSGSVNITGGTITGVTGLSAVTSVAGRTGAVVLANTDISGLGALATLNSVTGATGGVTVTSGASGSLVMGAVTLQWGTVTGSAVAVTFGTAFSGTPYSITISKTGATPANIYSTTSVTSSGFTANSYGSNSIAPSASTMFWMAIGPT